MESYLINGHCKRRFVAVLPWMGFYLCYVSPMLVSKELTADKPATKVTVTVCLSIRVSCS